MWVYEVVLNFRHRCRCANLTEIAESKKHTMSKGPFTPTFKSTIAQPIVWMLKIGIAIVHPEMSTEPIISSSCTSIETRNPEPYGAAAFFVIKRLFLRWHVVTERKNYRFEDDDINLKSHETL